MAAVLIAGAGVVFVTLGLKNELEQRQNREHSAGIVTIDTRETAQDRHILLGFDQYERRYIAEENYQVLSA